MRAGRLRDGDTHDAGLGGASLVAGDRQQTSGPWLDPLFRSRHQYCADDYRKLVAQFGMQASMSRRGNCYDNAPMESFWGSLKNETIHHQRYATRANP